MRIPLRAALGRLRPLVTGVLVGAFSLVQPPSSIASPTDGPPERGHAYMGMGVAVHDGHGGLPAEPRTTQTEGVDVASYQGDVAWSTLSAAGVGWAYSKATEGTYYKNPYFSSQYRGAYDAGLIHGAYHFATPDTTSGATQAAYFVDRGGSWTGDGRTLPGVLDIEWNPYGAACYGKSKSEMVSWVRDFLTTYKQLTGRAAVIYTATSWWTDCTGDYSGFAADNPLWIARYAATPGPLPAGWSTHTMWQYTSSGTTVGDHDRFNGSLDKVRALATG